MTLDCIFKMYRIQAGSRAHPASYPMSEYREGSFPGVKAARVKNAWSCTSAPPSTSSWRGA